ncbi:josephin-1-like [Centruroides sculpturatus]|uniref:josephin-1-like n=1 Tax=Centruroides sculpturatus TaxID=218467 RepID=UPI000C6DB012|nr:josephin-1-like [Centruroides sculpturatus]XP_023221442.1 josephin-1-like [Centruroides sculpturatus]
MYRSCLRFVENIVKKDNNKNQVEVYKNTANNIYHERQVKELCALHALNNLFQNATAFSKEMLDDICHQLSPGNIVNPHKSMLGLGNYDVNVIMKALQYKHYEAIWFDKRRDPSCINLSQIKGFILNIPSEMKFGFIPLPINRKHWIAVREISGIYYNLDSKLDSPVVLGNETELLTYLREQINSKEREIFVVVRQELTDSWRNDIKLESNRSLTGSGISTTVLSLEQETYNYILPDTVVTAFVSPASSLNKKDKRIMQLRQPKATNEKLTSFSFSDTESTLTLQ